MFWSSLFTKEQKNTGVLDALSRKRRLKIQIMLVSTAPPNYNPPPRPRPGMSTAAYQYLYIGEVRVPGVQSVPPPACSSRVELSTLGRELLATSSRE